MKGKLTVLGEARLTRLGLVLLAVGLALVAAVHSYATLLVALTLMPLGTAFVFPCVTAMLSRVVPKRNRGLYMGVQHTFGGVSRVVFPFAAGVAMDHLGLGFPFVIAGVLVLATLLLTTSMEDYAATRAPSMT
jgi:MFS family permease